MSRYTPSFLGFEATLTGLDVAAKALAKFPDAIETAQRRAVAGAADAMQAEAARRITERYYINRSYFRNHISADYVQGEKTATIRVWGHRLLVSYFRVTPKHRPFRAGKFRRGNGISFAIKREGGMHNMRRGFWLEGWKSREHGMPFYRYASARDGSDYDSDFMAGMRPIVTMAIPQMMKTSQVLEPVIAYGQERMTQQLHYWIGRALMK